MVRGVDIQRVLAQFNQAEKLQFEQLNSPETQQRLLSIQQQQHSLLKKITVQKNNSAEQKKIDADKRREQFKKRGRQNPENTGEEVDAEEKVLREQVGIGGKINIDA
ncbi:MAG: hypothetical protein HYT87_19235 [Nitrospirae bacterium]|nr:hypothetical protein [Nitrospirota bacterium]